MNMVWNFITHKVEVVTNKRMGWQ